jgi:autotransporter-associated beta strand protein
MVTLNSGGGTFSAGGSTNSTLSGVISGAGALTMTGPGTLSLTGTNTYSGGTSFNGGILAVNSSANLGTGALSFNGGTLQALATGSGIAWTKAVALNSGGGTFSAGGTTTSTVSGVISGSGAFTLAGTGTLVLSGTNTYSGGTVLNGGTLTVNSAQALGLGNVQVNGGVLRADPQPINVKGNYTQGAAGTLDLQVAGASAGQYDSLKVGGNASLGGTLQLLALNGFKPKVGNQLTLVTTGGVISNQFAQFIDPFSIGSGYNTVELVYGKNSVLLEFLNLTKSVPPADPPAVIATINFESFALTPNQRAAGNLLDEVQLNPKATDLISFLYKKPVANLPGDLEKISPDALTAFYEISFSNANIQRLNLEGRLDDLRSGSNGFSSSWQSD